MILQSLLEINKKYQSDKGGKHPYLEKYYSNLFAPIRNNNLNFLEIGVYHGASLKLWRDYFPNANFHGVDLKNRKNYFNNLDRITLHQGKSDQPSTYKNLKTQFDIIIDDGNHRSATQIPTFKLSRPMVKQGGYYIIEDVVDLQDLQTYFDGIKIFYTVYDYSNTHEKDSIIIQIKK